MGRSATKATKQNSATTKTAPWNQRTTSPRNTIGQPDRKRRGEASEAAFIARALSLNLQVAKLWGESDSIDILVGAGQGSLFWRVQVKCAHALHRSGGYEIKGGGRHLYTAADIDFLAAHIVPHDRSNNDRPDNDLPDSDRPREGAWYIVPIHAFEGSPFLYFYPHPRRRKSRARYEKYREAWCLLACTEKARGWDDIPVLCRCRELPVRCASCPLK